MNRMEIESINRDLLAKNEALRASVDVLSSVNSQTVHLLIFIYGFAKFY